MTRPTRKGEHLAGADSLVRSSESRYYNPGTRNLSRPRHCWLPVSAATISLRVGDCAAGTTVPNGAGARHPARPSLACWHTLTPSAGRAS